MSAGGVNIMYSKNCFDEAIEKYDQQIQKELHFLYNCYMGKENLKRSELKAAIKQVVTSIFGKGFSKEIMIPYSFIDSIVGKVLMDLLFNDKPIEFALYDIAYLYGLKNQDIYNDLRKGLIKGVMKHNMWFITEREVQRYIKALGLPCHKRTKYKNIKVDYESIQNSIKMLDSETKAKINMLYAYRQGENACDAPTLEIEKVLAALFKKTYMQDLTIPYDFIVTNPLGEFLFYLLVNNNERYYTIKELESRLNMDSKYAVVFLNKERTEGRIISTVKHNKHFFSETEVLKYIHKKQ